MKHTACFTWGFLAWFLSFYVFLNFLTEDPSTAWCRLVSRSGRDMELKKSISDTERALRSYGAVSDTAWTADKGERPAGTHVAVGDYDEPEPPERRKG